MAGLENAKVIWPPNSDLSSNKATRPKWCDAHRRVIQTAYVSSSRKSPVAHGACNVWTHRWSSHQRALQQLDYMARGA